MAVLALAPGALRQPREHTARGRRLSVLRFTLAEIDALDDRQLHPRHQGVEAGPRMSPTGFEHACAELL
ncbi:hypothetical protein ACIRP2_29215 [Streptomyces sp. NPDC101194]|uniref:hypothetical protein n=1 Tax=Streptomyces sp. NPDC101194 TaxID=3366127 RepID=UPI0037F3CADF